MDSASVALFLVDDRQRCAFMSLAAERLTGLTISEVEAADEPLHDILHRRRPDFPACCEACSLSRALSGQTRVRGQDVLVHADGHPHPVAFTVSPVLSEGNVVGHLIEAQDLTVTQQGQAWLEAVVDGSPVGISVFDRDLRFVRVNRALAELNGLSPAEHIGKTLRDVVPEAGEQLERPYREALSTGKPAVDVEVAAHVSGRAVDALVSIYPVTFEGSVLGVVGMVRDDTAHKREERRRTLMAKASRILASSLDVATVTKQVSTLFVPDLADCASVYLRQDDGSFELAAVTHRIPTEESAVRAVYDSAPRASRERWITARTIRSGDAELVETVTNERLESLADGDWAWLSRAKALGATSLLSVPLVVQPGHTIGSVLLMRQDRCCPFDQGEVPSLEDVTRRAAVAIDNAHLFEMAQRERRRADEANRAKDEFLAMVSHELRTPLNSMLGWARLLLMGSLDPTKTRRAIETIERNAIAQTQLIEDLLDVSRIITGKLRLEPQRFEMASVIDAAVEVVAPAAHAKNIQLVSTIDRTLGSMVGDPHRLQQAVWNLLTNAIKFTPQGGRVAVRLSRSGASCVVTVEDTGEGIEPAFLRQVFDRFRQAEMGSKRRHGGLGLGLPIVRHITELHGGTVEAFSEGSGKGSTFRLSIPTGPVRTVERSTPVPVTTSSAPSSADFASSRARIRGLSVLVVEDEQDARELIASMLTLCGATVTTAPSVGLALQEVIQHRPDVIVSDIGMPDEDGYDLIERVRTLPPVEGGRTPAIALTAYARSADRSRALLAGFNAHVTKPVEPAELIAIVAEVSGRPAIA
jgi:PAS domain S-box-containing protein